jgi:hypothetical protein
MPSAECRRPQVLRLLTADALLLLRPSALLLPARLELSCELQAFDTAISDLTFSSRATSLLHRALPMHHRDRSGQRLAVHNSSPCNTHSHKTQPRTAVHVNANHR